MPQHKAFVDNIRELYKDNKKKGKEKGANGKARSRKQMIAIAFEMEKRMKKYHS